MRRVMRVTGVFCIFTLINAVAASFTFEAIYYRDVGMILLGTFLVMPACVAVTILGLEEVI